MKRPMLAAALVVVLLNPMAVLSGDGHATAWTFVVSGDSRNCGDVVMPSIAHAAREEEAAFYWHLGDLRWITDIDDDYAQLNPGVSLRDYRAAAWDDFIRNDIEPFGNVPFILGIGNHETTGGMTREKFMSHFSRWLDSPALRSQRLQDDSDAVRPRTYYHWHRDGIDFVNLDNASADQFDPQQQAWLNDVLARDATDRDISAIVLGMHEALPESVASGHSMDDSAAGRSSGRAVYLRLLELARTKSIYVLASHSHYYMGDAFDTPYWRAHGGVLKGWIVGTAGARRYRLPWELYGNEDHRDHVYGFLLATVNPVGSPERVQFAFHEVTEAQVPPDVLSRYGAAFVHFCYARNP